MHTYGHFISMGENVGLTATTGIACQQFPGHAKPITIHRYKMILADPGRGKGVSGSNTYGKIGNKNMQRYG
jgi:hypothetical protein